METANKILERERSGYRFIAGRLAPVAEEAEIAALEGAISAAAQVGLEGVRAHIQEALRFLSLRPEPAYRNAIKESISIVESAVKGIAGLDQGGLDQALRVLDQKAPIHGALRAGFLNLYGYSSDEEGIRHALLEAGANIGFDEAKFMVVACSAFAHFLIAKAQAAGLLRS